MRFFLALAALAATLLAPLPAPAASDADDGERAEVLRNAESALQAFYQARPRLRSEVKAAAGYAVFSGYGNLLGSGSSAGRGAGVAVGGRGEREVFMGMGPEGAAPKDASDREVLILFATRESFDAFARQGWKPVNAGAKPEGARVFAHSRNTVEADASLAGTRFWVDRTLN